jgi:hypothetical protein
MTTAQFEDPEGRALVEAIHARKEYVVPTTTRPILLPTEPERTGTT